MRSGDCRTILRCNPTRAPEHAAVIDLLIGVAASYGVTMAQMTETSSCHPKK
jgi:hypothetical protein